MANERDFYYIQTLFFLKVNFPSIPEKLPIFVV